jgi:hypothetical protein
MEILEINAVEGGDTGVERRGKEAGIGVACFWLVGWLFRFMRRKPLCVYFFFRVIHLSISIIWVPFLYAYHYYWHVASLSLSFRLAKAE